MANIFSQKSCHMLMLENNVIQNSSMPKFNNCVRIINGNCSSFMQKILLNTE